MNNKKIYNSIVKIITSDVIFDINIPYNITKQHKSIGAGFYIDNEGHILTAAHCVKNTIDIKINIPKYGKKNFNGEIICVYPDFDLAIIKIIDYKNDYNLKLGNSDQINIGDEVYALGYPDGSNHPLRTAGTISGRRDIFIQGDVPLNPGNSGGPVFNKNHEVIGVSAAKLSDSEDSSLIVPINIFKNVKNIMLKSKNKIIYKNVLGILLRNNDDYYLDFHNLKEKINKGVVIGKILEKSPLKSLIKEGDIICKINDIDIDYYGEVNVDWEEAKVPINYIIERTLPNGTVNLDIFDIKKKINIRLNNIKLMPLNLLYPIREIFTHIEKYSYEVFGGMIVMNLTLDHIKETYKHLIHMIIDDDIYNPYLIISHIFENSKISEFENINKGLILDKVNDLTVRTIEDYRKALLNPIIVNDKKYLKIKILSSYNEFIIDLKTLLEQEPKFIDFYKYNESQTYMALKN